MTDGNRTITEHARISYQEDRKGERWWVIDGRDYFGPFTTSQEAQEFICQNTALAKWRAVKGEADHTPITDREGGCA